MSKPEPTNEAGAPKSVRSASFLQRVRDVLFNVKNTRTFPARIGAEEFWNDVLEGTIHYTNSYLGTLRDMIFHPKHLVEKYLIGETANIQNPIAFFLLSFLLYNFIAGMMRSHADGGTFAGVDKWWALIGVVGPVLIGYLIVTRPRFNFWETFVFFLFLNGAIFVLLLAGLALQFFAPGIAIHAPDGLKGRLNDIFYSVLAFALSLNFVRQADLSILRYFIALGCTFAYFFYFPAIVDYLK